MFVSHLLVGWRNRPRSLVGRNNKRLCGVQRFMRLTIMISVAAAICIASIGSANAQRTKNSDLEIKLVRLQLNSAKPVFAVKLFNAGQEATVLNLGMMLGNGKAQYATAVTLYLLDARGKTTPLELVGPAIFGGRVDPLVFPLPVGATLTLPVDLAKYVSPKKNIWDIILPPGRYELRASYTGVSAKDANFDMKGVSLMPYWTGTVVSRPLLFNIKTTVQYSHQR